MSATTERVKYFSKEGEVAILKLLAEALEEKLPAEAVLNILIHWQDALTRVTNVARVHYIQQPQCPTNPDHIMEGGGV